MSINKKRSHNEINVQLKQKESKFAVKTGKDDISLPAVIVFSGSRGSGKTYSCIALMRHFEKKTLHHQDILVVSYPSLQRSVHEPENTR